MLLPSTRWSWTGPWQADVGPAVDEEVRQPLIGGLAVPWVSWAASGIACSGHVLRRK